MLSFGHERVRAATVGGLRCDKHQWIFFSLKVSSFIDGETLNRLFSPFYVSAEDLQSFGNFLNSTFFTKSFTFA